MIVIYDDATYTVFNAILEKSATVNLEYMGEDDNEGSYPQPMQQNRLAYVKRIGNNWEYLSKQTPCSPDPQLIACNHVIAI